MNGAHAGVAGARTVGRYEVVHEIGRGAMATVYVARQLDLERRVALKELRALGALDPSSARRFLREAKLAGSFSHPNIVTVHDYFEHDRVPYIAMEYIAPGSLRPYVGRLTLPQIGGVLEGLLAGLAHAQRRQVVHRDIKPENLLVTLDGGIKIADFGIAKATQALEQHSMLTASGTTVGTPNYIAPEQAMAHELGPWTDLYSVGITAFELLLGRTPFGDTGEAMGVVLRQINEPVPWISDLAPNVDTAISDWVSWLVSKSPADRPQTAVQAWDTLDEVLLGLLGPRWRREASLLAAGDQSTARSTPAAPSRAVGAYPAATVGPQSPGGPPAAAAAAAAAGAVGAVGAAGALSRRKTRRATDPWLAATIPPRRLSTVQSAARAPRLGRLATMLKMAAVAATLVAVGAIALSAGHGGPPTGQSSGQAGLNTGPATAASNPAQAPTQWADAPLADQVAPATQLAHTYEQSASRISAGIHSGPGSAADIALVSALRRTASAYRDAAAAAGRDDLAGYSTAVAAAAAGRQEVSTLIQDSTQGSATVPTPAPGTVPPPASSPTPAPPPSANPCAGDSTSDDPSDDGCGGGKQEP
ncbi:MAG: serine/threonine protein kinase [Nocardioides sp.]|nr:serine/threonine protein kinase [Nocardioides sp.]